jgi:hypothetical protein
MVAWAWWTVREFRGNLGYSQSRPKDLIRRNGPRWAKPSYFDCSSLMIRMYQVYGQRSPSVYGYSGYGSTHDMEGHGKRVSRPQIGDLIFYWRGHVGVVVDIARKIQIGHGSSAAPKPDGWYYRSDFSSFRQYVPTVDPNAPGAPYVTKELPRPRLVKRDGRWEVRRGGRLVYRGRYPGALAAQTKQLAAWRKDNKQRR